MAGLSIDVTSDLGTLDGDLRRAGRLALRNLSADLRDGHRTYLRDNLDQPTTYTENSLYVVGTTSATPEVLVGVKDSQAAYLKYAYRGGHREDALTPTLDADLDGRGNIPLGYTQAVVAAGGFWLTTRRGIRGLFDTDGRAVALMLDTDYDKRLDFESEITDIVAEAFPDAATKAFAQVFGGS